MFSCYHFEAFTGFGILTELLQNNYTNLTSYPVKLFAYDSRTITKRICYKADALFFEVEHIEYSGLSFRQNDFIKQFVYVCSCGIAKPRIDCFYG